MSFTEVVETRVNVHTVVLSSLLSNINEVCVTGRGLVGILQNPRHIEGVKSALW